MRVLEFKEPRMNGSDVNAWQSFLARKGFPVGRVDGYFGMKTRDSTVAFQRRHNLFPDGVVGQKTLQTAHREGFLPVAPQVPVPNAPNNHPASGAVPANGAVPPNSLTYPPVPKNLPAPTLHNAVKLFGSFAYEPNPSSFNGRGIKVTDGWDKRNIVTITVPQLRGVPIYGVPGSGKMQVHRLVARQMLELFQAWEDAGLIHLVLTFSGSYAPRFIGGTHTLSNHSFGAAFDINEQWNGQPRTPVATGQHGSVRELVPIANSFGFYWGGHYTRRKDGMHFEVVVLK